MKIKNRRLMWDSGYVITPSLVWLRMKYRFERLSRKWGLEYGTLYKEEMCWRVYTIEDGKKMYYNCFKETKWQAIWYIVTYVWFGSGYKIL